MVVRMETLALYLFGAPRLERAGAPLRMDTHKALALLIYLVTTQRPQSRDTLAALLWPNHEQARAILRRTFSPLRATLGEDWFTIDRDTIGLRDPKTLWTDTGAFRLDLQACQRHPHPPSEVCDECMPLLSEAVALYHSEFLAGFPLRDCAPFDDWRAYQSEALRRELIEALERVSRGEAERRRLDVAITLAQRWLAVDPLGEAAHRRLMLLLAWSGQRNAALQQYRMCAQALERELGVAPLEPTTRLYEAIRANRITLPERLRPPVGAPKPPRADATEERAPLFVESQPTEDLPTRPPTSLPFVGRTQEWARLMEVYEQSGVDGKVALVVGEAGIGKTRLIEEFVANITRRGAALASARCYEGESGLAYGPIITLLRSALARPEKLNCLKPTSLAEVARLLPELAARRSLPLTSLDAPGARIAFFEAVCEALLAAGASDDGRTHPPGVLVIEDAQWADSASVDLITFLMRRLHGQRVVLLLSWGEFEALANVSLQRLQAEVARDAIGATLRLTRLHASVVRKLTEQARLVSEGDGARAEALSARLYRETEGVPLLLTEYLTALRAGVLKADNREWSLPGGARDLLHARLSLVGEMGWQMLHTIAIMGRSFDFDTAREVSGRSEEEAVAALEELVARGVIVETRDVSVEGPALTYEFVHEKLRTLAYEETSLARRRLLHRRLAETLVNQARLAPGVDMVAALAPTIARHFALGGLDAQSAIYSRLAGDRARALGAHAEALTHYDAALAQGHPAIAELHEAIGDAQTMLGVYDAALRSYTLAGALSTSQALATIERKCAEVFARRGEWEAAEVHLEAAAAALGESETAEERARIFADWSRVASRRAQPELALHLAGEALTLARAGDDDSATAQALNMLGILATRQGNGAQAVMYLSESLAIAQHLPDRAAHAAALNNLALAYAACDEMAQAQAFAEQALAVGETLGDRHHLAALHNNLADILYATGDSEAVMTHLKEAVTIYMEIGFEAGVWQPEIWKLNEW
jgi:DNA-binding SARP family transcriptional activator/tetratricopeptide (TPR) repeat protein